MKKVFERPKSMIDVPMHYCSGCGHSIVHRLVCEVVDELGIRDRMIAVAPVGCAVLAYDYWDFDMTEAAHGRAPAIATGLKRTRPGCIVLSYQGDGDLASIGMAEIIHAASRGEKISVIFINNAVYGMTGGQMAPTTLMGQKTTTSPYGRKAETAGYPIKMCELLNTLQAPSYLERIALTGPGPVNKLRRAIRHSLRLQMEGKAFSMIEVLSSCPTNWGMDPVASLDAIEKKMVPVFPLGVFRDITGERK